jgi:hypothetical protein
MRDKRLRELFESALRAKDLRSLVTELRSWGLSQVAIYDLFESFMLVLREENREPDEDAVGDALDFICGWCSSNLMWFEQRLTNEELDAFRRANRG